MFAQSRKKTKFLNSTDRFIPVRQNSDGFDDNALPVANTPYNQRVYTALMGMTIEQYNKRKLLFFSTESAQRALELRQNRPVIKKSIVTPTLEAAYKILDTPDSPDDYYYCRIAWSTNERIYMGLPETSLKWSIFSESINKPTGAINFNSQNTPLNTINTYHDDYVFSGWGDGVIRVYQLSASSYAPTHEISTQENAITSTAIINQTTLCVGYQNGLIGQLDLRASPSNCTYYDDRGPETTVIIGLTYNQEYYLLSGASDSIVRTWDIRHMCRPVFKMDAHTAATKALAFNPLNNRQFISGGGSTCKRFFLTNITTQTSQELINTQAQITGIHWFPSDPRYFVSSHSDGLKLWSKKPCHSLTLLSSQTTEYRIHTLVGSPSGEQFAAASADGYLSFFNKPQGIENTPSSKKRSPLMLSTGMSIR